MNTVVEDFLTQFTLLHYYPRHYLCIAFCVIRVLLHMYILLAKKVQQKRQGKNWQGFLACLMQALQICPYQERFSKEILDKSQVTFLFCCVWCKEFLFYQSAFLHTSSQKCTKKMRLFIMSNASFANKEWSETNVTLK